jgi:hypothetical protein
MICSSVTPLPFIGPFFSQAGLQVEEFLRAGQVVQFGLPECRRLRLSRRPLG